MRKTLSNYAERPFDIVHRGPYRGSGAKLRSFFVDGDLSRMQNYCDLSLNDPADGATRYKVATKRLMLNFLHHDSVASLHNEDSKLGYVEELDVGFWMLVVGGVVEEGAIVDPHFRWLPISLFVDSAAAMAVGREVFGFPKSIGEFLLPEDRPHFGEVDVSGHALKNRGPNEKAKVHKLFSIRQRHHPAVKSAEEDRSGEEFRSLDEVDGAITSHLSEHLIPAEPLSELFRKEGIGIQDLAFPQISIPFLNMPWIFLKQFRDVRHQNGACYQAITEASGGDVDLMRAWPRLTAFDLDIHETESFPFMRELGLKQTQPLYFPLWVDFDFTAKLGQEIWAS